jgi:SAM-dependent methyltransferase
VSLQKDNFNRFLQEQIDYYQARAGEYDEWFLRQGRYDRGPENNRRWFSELEAIRQKLDSFGPRGSVLELACGTGLWTQYLLKYADHITAVDAVSQVLALNRERNHSSKVAYVRADIFDWQPDRQYDVVFFSFWLSHISPERFTSFWGKVGLALRPGGRVFFIDSRYESTSTATDHRLKDKGSIIADRWLNDGRKFQIVKVFYDSADLSRKLVESGWDCTIDETENYFYCGYGLRAQAL